MSKIKNYTFTLPVFKQGDDFDHLLSKSPGDPALALKALALNYTEAANLCRRVAGAISEAPEGAITARGCTHRISIEAHPELIAGLVADGVLELDDYEEEGDEYVNDFVSEEGGDDYDAEDDGPRYDDDLDEDEQ